MSHPFDRVKKWEKVSYTLVNQYRNDIHQTADTICRKAFGLDSIAWIDLALDSPDWARRQLMDYRRAMSLAEEVMQEHVLPKLVALDQAPLHMAGHRKYGLKASLSQTFKLAEICARSVKNLEGGDVDKSIILREFRSTLTRGRRGGLER